MRRGIHSIDTLIPGITVDAQQALGIFCSKHSHLERENGVCAGSFDVSSLYRRTALLLLVEVDIIFGARILVAQTCS